MSALRQRARQWGVSIAALILPEAVDSLLRESTSDEPGCWTLRWSCSADPGPAV